MNLFIKLVLFYTVSAVLTTALNCLKCWGDPGHAVYLTDF